MTVKREEESLEMLASGEFSVASGGGSVVSSLAVRSADLVFVIMTMDLGDVVE